MHLFTCKNLTRQYLSLTALQTHFLHILTLPQRDAISCTLVPQLNTSKWNPLLMHLPARNSSVPYSAQPEGVTTLLARSCCDATVNNPAYTARHAKIGGLCDLCHRGFRNTLLFHCNSIYIYVYRTLVHVKTFDRYIALTKPHHRRKLSFELFKLPVFVSFISI